MAADQKWKKTALLVIDMQNDFLSPDSPLYVNGGPNIIPNVIKAVDVARHRGIHIIWVVREHDPLGRDVELCRRHLYVDGGPKPTSKGSAGAELSDGLVINEGDYKLVKTRFSAFFATHLHSLLQGIGINSLVIVGVQTPNCIRQTVFDAVALDYPSVTVIVDATAAATPDVHFALFKNVLPQGCKASLTLHIAKGCFQDLKKIEESNIPLTNILDMKNIGIATPTLHEWCESKD